MAMTRKLPDTGQLVSWVELGWTHQRIADHIYATTGQTVSRTSISAALSRAGKTAEHPRYKDCLPWRVETRHLTEYPARMLRLLGKRRAGGQLTDNENKRLDSWLQALAEANAVVGYDPDCEGQGFHYVDPLPGADTAGIPIRTRRIHTQLDESSVPDYT